MRHLPARGTSAETGEARGVGAALKHNELPELREVALLAQPIRLTPHEVDARRYRHDRGAQGTGRPYAGAGSDAGIAKTDRRSPHEPPSDHLLAPPRHDCDRS